MMAYVKIKFSFLSFVFLFYDSTFIVENFQTHECLQTNYKYVPAYCIVAISRTFSDFLQTNEQKICDMFIVPIYWA